MLLLFNDFLKDLLYESSHSLGLPDSGFAIGFQGFCRMSRLYVFTLKPAFKPQQHAGAYRAEEPDDHEAELQRLRHAAVGAHARAGHPGRVHERKS